MSKILLIFSHGDFPNSKVNRVLLDGVTEMPDLTVHNLNVRYPDFTIDVPHEQALLLAHDIIVLQFPMYWYSCPALMKHWIDLVWARHFAYGGGNHKLAGKTLACAISAGGSADDFQPEGFYGYRFEDFLPPFEISAKFCKMVYRPPFYILDALELTPAELQDHVDRYRGWLDELRTLSA